MCESLKCVQVSWQHVQRMNRINIDHFSHFFLGEYHCFPVSSLSEGPQPADKSLQIEVIFGRSRATFLITSKSDLLSHRI